MTPAFLETSEMNVGNESQGGSDDLYVFPASFAQQRLWFLHQLEPQSAAYNISKAIRLAGDFNVAVFARALNEIIRRHEILRTTFAMLGGQPMQLVSEYQPVTLPLIDLSALERAERLSHQLAAEEASRPFNLRRGPLLRTTLLRLAPDDHVALFTMHHIISDAWSVGVFIKEFTALYAAFKAGEQSPLPELPIQYGDYAEWQRDSLQGELLEKQLSYWEEHLAAVPAVIELPVDHARPTMPSGKGAKLAFDLGPELLGNLKELSKRKDATLFMTLLAAWQVLLYRYSGQDQVCVGTPVAGRTRAETENLIGFFINTLVLRTDLSGNPTFVELLQRVRAVCLGAYAHQDIPFERIVDHLQPERSLSHTPLFQVMFALQNTRSEILELPGLELLHFDSEIRTSKFDLTLSLSESYDTLAGAIEYNTDLFDEETISRMLGHFRQLLRAITADPQQHISDLSLLSDSEHRQLLIDFNDTAAEFPQDVCLHQLIEQQVERTPEQTALVFEEEKISYRELNARANQLAHHLRALGVGPEARIGILLERSVEMVVALLGVLKAGGAYVPLDPEYPAERLRFMLEDAQVAVLITQPRLAATLPSSSAPLLLLEESEQLAQYETGNPGLLGGAENLAYIIYTSGSTGQPKGAMNTHRGIVNRLLWMQATYGLNQEDRVLQKTPFSFDVSVWEFFWPLLTGARLVLARPGGHRDGQYLRELIIKEQITTLHFVPSMLRVFLEEEGLEQCRTLRRVISSGEELPAEVAAHFFSRMDWAELHNLYGPTEAAVDVTSWECRPEWEGRVPIGKPIWNTQVYVLDGAQRPVPQGVTGELYLGGMQVGRGYWQRAELTAEKFVPDPYCGERGARLYRTGDVVRQVGAGVLEYVGRADYQVKVRGYRIELGEVEAALREQDSVRECVVVARHEGNSAARLVGYVVLDEGASYSVTALRQELLQRLPEYMIPASFVQLQELPLTANGKLDRRALPDPDHQRPALETERVAPRTAVEETLVRIWSEVLGLSEVGIHDNFFELGGDSILSIQIVARANQAGLRLAPKHLFQYQTVAELALMAEQAAITDKPAADSRTSGESDFPTVNLSQQQLDKFISRVGRANIEDILSLSPMQKGLLFHSLYAPDSGVYFQQVHCVLRGNLNIEAFKEAWQQALNRHSILRTSFFWEEELKEPVQVVNREVTLSIELEDWSELTAAEQQSRLVDFLEADRRRGFELSRAPLLRLALLRLDDQRHRLIWSHHHLLLDGWSIPLLLKEVFIFYEGLCRNEPVQLAQARPYGDYISWLQSQSLEEAERYWREKLRGLTSPTTIARAGERSAGAEGEYRGQRLHLSEAETAELSAVARRHQLTLNTVVQGAWSILLSRYSGEREVVFGTTVAGRPAELDGVEQMVGVFINTLPMRVRINEGERVSEWLRGLQAEAVEMRQYEYSPLIDVTKWSEMPRGTPLFESLFVFDNYPVNNSSSPSQASEIPTIEDVGYYRRANYPLMLIVAPDTELRWTLSYEADLFDEEMISRLLGHFRQLLRVIAADPQQTVSDLSLLSDSERHQLLREFNDTAAEFPQDVCLHELIEQQVTRTPEQTAVVFEEKQVSYRELNERANQLAHHLHALGVKAESPVGILLERSVEMVVALL
ncbi:MAG TPA: amino acid adenylation domain-containing protein, partial [Pyrinomonadaceae bacterium]|nr:amino acid adenylation domain-containing protein [Pyrinomonadaceae bacterium]